MIGFIKKAPGYINARLYPPGINLADHGRRRLFVFFLLALIFPLIIFGVVHHLTGRYSFGLVNFFMAALLFSFIILLCHSHTGKTIYRVTLVLLILLLSYWMKTGVGQGYGSMFVLCYPVFAFFLMGKKEGCIWSILLLLVAVILLLNPFAMESSFTYTNTFLFRYFATFFIIFCGTYYYESVREQFQKAMEIEHNELQKEKNHLAAAKNEVDATNRALHAEMEVRKHVEDELRKHQENLEALVAERTRELRENNEKLQAGERRYRFLAENVTDLIWATDVKLHNTFFSPSVYNIFGYTVEEAMHLTMDQLYTPESCRKILQEYRKQMALEKEGTADPERSVFAQVEQIKKDKTIMPVEIKVSCARDANGKPVGFVGVTRDISERKKIEQERARIQEQLNQAQKMEALGTLVGGLAHDFNNILGGIIGSFDVLNNLLAQEKLTKSDKINKCVRIGTESAKRSAELIKQLLLLCRKSEIKLFPIDINDSLKHILELCKNSFPKSIELDFQWTSKPLMIMSNMIQIEQVILNLCINASHAMTLMRPEGDNQGGVLTVKVGKVKDISEIIDLYPDMAHGGSWVEIMIADTGIGMDDATRVRIFEPFFSKKKQNEGSGLGLAISYNIIEKHGGLVRVKSEPGAGSAFSLYFPLVIDAGIANHPAPFADRIVMGRGTILVVDDETIILDVAREILEQCGYDVLTAESADRGIDIYRINHEKIDAVLLDLSMPGKTGLEVFANLQEINNNVRVLLSSGMLSNEAREMAVNMGITDIVDKPYRAGELSKRIKALIDQN